MPSTSHIDAILAKESRLLTLFSIVETIHEVSLACKDDSLDEYCASCISDMQQHGVEHLSIGNIRYATEVLLIPLQEGTGVLVELFWEKLNTKGLQLKRDDRLRKVLSQNRIRSVHFAIPLRNEWYLMKVLPSVLRRFSTAEINHLQRIVDQDEADRVAHLRKVLQIGRLSLSNCARFGNSRYYLTECGLFEKYFTEQDNQQMSKLSMALDQEILNSSSCALGNTHSTK